MEVIRVAYHPLKRNIDDTKRARVKQRSSWMEEAETVIDGVTNIDFKAGEADWISSYGNCNHFIIRIGK